MADIHTFPTRLNGDAVRRVTEKLSAAFEAGEDVGSRTPHIHALAEALKRTLLSLEQELANLAVAMTPVEFEELLRTAAVDTICEQLKQLIAKARVFPNLLAD